MFYLRLSSSSFRVFFCFPPSPPPQFYYFPSSSSSSFFLFPAPPPPQFYYFPPSSFSLFLIPSSSSSSSFFNIFSIHKYVDPKSTPHRLYTQLCFSASWIVKLYTITTTFLLFSLHHHISIVFSPPSLLHFYCFSPPPFLLFSLRPLMCLFLWCWRESYRNVVVMVVVAVERNNRNVVVVVVLYSFTIYEAEKRSWVFMEGRCRVDVGSMYLWIEKYVTKWGGGGKQKKTKKMRREGVSKKLCVV